MKQATPLPPPSLPSPQLKRGLLLVFEGIDGSGKSSQCRLLAGAFQRVQLDLVLSREPTDGPWGQRIRQLARLGRPLSAQDELELFLCDRRQHIGELLRPSLEEKKIVLLDRYYFSSAAYQGSRGLDPQAILRLHEAFAPRPDAVFLLDLAPEEALERIRASRPDPPDHFEVLDNLSRCRAIFNSLSLPQLFRLDGRLPPEVLHQEILEHLQPLLCETLCLHHQEDPSSPPCDPSACALSDRCSFPPLWRQLSSPAQ